MIKLWVDDERQPPEGWIWAKTFDEAVDAINHNELEIISLDHDLGIQSKTGYELAKWLSQNQKWPSLVNIHSANPVGVQNIEFEVKFYNKHFGSISQITKEKPYLDKNITEGTVAKIRSRATRLLNQKAYSILGFAEALDLDGDITEATDSNQAVIEIQFGNNKLFKKSQVASVTIYDGDDYVIELPAAISMLLDISNHKKIKNLRDTKTYIKKLKSQLDQYIGTQI